MQRSSLREIVIGLSSAVSNVDVNDVVVTNLGVDADSEVDARVQLQQNQIALSSDGRTLTLSFEEGELNDGVYQLELSSSLTGGDAIIEIGNNTNRFFVLEGDWNGSGAVNIQDFATFAYWFGQSTPDVPEYVDLNGSGAVNIQDFAFFAANFGRSIVLPAAEGEQLDDSTPAPTKTDLTDQAIRSLTSESRSFRR